MNYEQPNEKREKNINLTPDQILNLLLIWNSMHTGESMMDDKIKKASQSKQVSVPVELASDLNTFANDKDTLMSTLDKFHRLINSLEIEK